MLVRPLEEEAGIAAANQVIEENVSAIITGNLGPNAFELIEKGRNKSVHLR